MKPESQQIAMAELDGFTDCAPYKETNLAFFAAHGRKLLPSGIRVQCHLPDYLSDLNAVHEVEKKLTNDQLHTYCNVLRRIVEQQELQGLGRSYIFTATAAQRVEAILRTTGRWDDTK